MSDKALRAMLFAREAHRRQRRKYTSAPYTDHLAEVAGIVAAVADAQPWSHTAADMIAVAWLHDTIEDTSTVYAHLLSTFGLVVADAVLMLSDLEEGNRATRKQLSRERLAKAEGWIQTIKVADLISNTGSIAQFDPGFAKVYLEEKRLLLDVMTEAHPKLLEIARTQIALA